MIIELHNLFKMVAGKWVYIYNGGMLTVTVDYKLLTAASGYLELSFVSFLCFKKKKRKSITLIERLKSNNSLPRYDWNIARRFTAIARCLFFFACPKKNQQRTAGNECSPFPAMFPDQLQCIVVNYSWNAIKRII